MEERQIATLVFMGISGGVTLVMFILARTIGWKYMVQEKRCTAKTKGVVVRYTFVSYGDTQNGERPPIVRYQVDGKSYKVTGPMYTFISITFSSPFYSVKTEKEHPVNIYAQTFVTKTKKNNMLNYCKDPNSMAELFPIGSEVDVFYDPANPRLAYVLRYYNGKMLFWLFIIIGCLALFCCLALSVNWLFLNQ